VSLCWGFTLVALVVGDNPSKYCLDFFPQMEIPVSCYPRNSSVENKFLDQISGSQVVQLSDSVRKWSGHFEQKYEVFDADQNFWPPLTPEFLVHAGTTVIF
jgi:hypothetical protein